MFNEIFMTVISAYLINLVNNLLEILAEYLYIFHSAKLFNEIFNKLGSSFTNTMDLKKQNVSETLISCKNYKIQFS